MIQRNELRRKLRKWGFSPLLGILAAWILSLAGPQSHAQDAWWSMEGDFQNATDEVQFFFNLETPIDSTSRLWMLTHSYSGGHFTSGVNAASDPIASGGFDPILDLYDVTAGVEDFMGQNDDGWGTSSDCDARLTWQSESLAGGWINTDPLPSGKYRVDLTAFDFPGSANNSWAMDLVGAWLPVTVASVQTMGDASVRSLKFGADINAQAWFSMLTPASTITDELVVATSGTGKLFVNGGAYLHTPGTTLLGAGGEAWAYVYDPGVLWEANLLTVGGTAGGSGNLNIEKQGHLISGDTTVGGAMSNGSVLVDAFGDPEGSEARWDMTGSLDVVGAFWVHSQVIVQNGGRAMVSQDVAIYSTDPDGSATLTVQDDAELQVDGTLQLTTGGKLKISGGTVITADIDNNGGVLDWTAGTLHITDSRLRIDDSVYADLEISSLTVDSGMSLKVTSSVSPEIAFRIGDLGTGTLTIQNGGVVESHHGYIGVRTSADGTVNITGSTSRWTVTQDLGIGFQDSVVGQLNITDGQVSANSIWLGAYDTADGTVTVDNGMLTSTAVLAVGGLVGDDGVSGAAAGGTGRLTVQNGGTVDVASTLIVFGGGTVELSGSEIHAGSFINDQGGTFTHVDGTLTVNGGTFAPNAGGNYSIDSPDALKLPTVKLTDGASYTSTGTLFVGNSHSGLVEIRSGSTVSTLNGRFGWSAGTSHGKVIIDGELSRWTNMGDLEIGVRSSGEMWISDGGRVENTDGAIGAVAGSVGVVDVRSGGVWDNSSSLYVGGKFSAGGSGYLDVDNGRVDVANLLKVYPDGTISLHDGEIHVGAGGFQIDGGTLIGTGKGTIVMSGGGNVHNHGHVSAAWYDWTPDPLVITGGDYHQDPGGVLLFMIGGTELFEYAKLEIDSGIAFLDGIVEIQPIDLGGGPYTPSVGDRFDVLAATGGFAGTEFASLIAPTPPGLAWGIDYGANIVSLGVFLDADFDHDGDVDGHDFIVWQRGRGMLNPKHKDGDADGDSDVDGADLARWKLSFGSIAPAVPAGTAVPEPAGFVLALIAAYGLGGFRRSDMQNAR